MKEYIDNSTQIIQFICKTIHLKSNGDPDYQVCLKNFQFRLHHLEKEINKVNSKLLRQIVYNSDQMKRLEGIILDYCRKDQVHTELFNWQKCSFHDFHWFQDMYAYAYDKVLTKLQESINRNDKIATRLIRWRFDVLDEVQSYFNPFYTNEPNNQPSLLDWQQLSEWIKGQFCHWKDELPTLIQAMTIPAMLSLDAGYYGLATATMYFIYNAYNIKPRLIQILQATTRKVLQNLLSSPIVDIIRDQQFKLLSQQLDNQLKSQIQNTLKGYQYIYHDINHDVIDYRIVASLESIQSKLKLISQKLNVMDIMYIKKFEFSLLDLVDYQHYWSNYFTQDVKSQLFKCRIQCGRHQKENDVLLRRYNYQLNQSNVDDILSLHQSLR